MTRYDEIRKIILKHLGISLAFQIAPDKLEAMINELDDLCLDISRNSHDDGMKDGLNAR